MVVTPPLFPSLSPSRVKHSLEGQRRDVQLVPAGLHAEAASMRPRPSTDAPFVAALIVSQSDGQTQDARTARLAGEADAEWGLGCGGRGGGLQLGGTHALENHTLGASSWVLVSAGPPQPGESLPFRFLAFRFFCLEKYWDPRGHLKYWP